ncbi:MAG: DUF58 domain-containing protein [Proteobacteria bacterium]|nr:DUF58 domain-containing protein [Pseudomonadota bacterium]
MTPTLARRGRLILASAATFLVVSAIHGAPPLAALGSVIISALLTAYLWFFPTAILLRRKKIELSWWIPPGDQPGGALSVDRPFALHVAFRNHAGRRLRILNVRILGTSALQLPTRFEAVVPAGRQVEVVGEARAQATGYHVLHGAVLTFGDVLGLFNVRAYFPNPVAIKVFPRHMDTRSQALRQSGGAAHEQVGMHHVRRRGLAGELRELRDHTVGDSFRYIAWKATARQRKLMVRELETEIVVTHQILVDIAGTMRNGSPGRTKLDYAIETAAALARAALDSGDRVGLITFDSRIYSELKPTSGHHHYLKLLDRLIEIQSVVDEDLTDLTNSELVATVAKYLAHQEAIDVRLRKAPPIDDAKWERIQAGPSGELYDVAALSKVVGTLLKAMGQTRTHKASAPAWWWSRVNIGADSEPQMAKLRLFCRLRGIELPYRQGDDAVDRIKGLAAVAEKLASQSRADVLILISDLRGLIERPEVTARSLARARRSGQRMVVIAPFGPAFASAASTLNGQMVADVLTREEREHVEQARRLLVGHGVPVIEGTPVDSPAMLLRKLARARTSMRRVA